MNENKPLESDKKCWNCGAPVSVPGSVCSVCEELLDGFITK